MKKIATLLLILVTAISISGCCEKDTIKKLRESLALEQEESYTNLKQANDYASKVIALQDEVYSLNSQLSEKDSTIDNLNEQLSARTASSQTQETQETKNTTNYVVDYSVNDSYLAMKFWQDGNNYTSSSTTWHSDYNCSNKISTPVVIVSPVVDQCTLENGYKVYACMSSNGLVYTSYYPYLIKSN